jgi:uncharacterized protein YecE (DUF72 family)
LGPALRERRRPGRQRGRPLRRALTGGIHVGTSGWSYPTWRPAFYPAGTDPSEFLRLYAQRFDTVELNTTGYRLPAEDQFERWREQTPGGFTFAVKMPLTRLDRVGTFVERVAVLGERLGPVRITVQSARDDGMLAFLRGSLDPELAVAFDFRHESWDGVRDLVRVNDFDAEPFRYIRLREPPYDDADLRNLAARLRAPAWVFFRHEDEPTAPAYATRLRELLGS